MKPELLDCHWCGSARSIEFGLCQVCLMEYTAPVTVIRLPDARPSEGAMFPPDMLDTPDVVTPRVELASGD